MYWADYRKMKDKVDAFASWTDYVAGLPLPTKMRELVNKALKATNELKKEVDQESSPRLVYETAKEMKAEIAKCPWKNREHLTCLSCKCRTNSLKKKQRYNSYHPYGHESQTDLHPAEECNTGR